MLFVVFLLHTKGTHTLILEFLRLLFSLIHSFFQNEVRKNLLELRQLVMLSDILKSVLEKN